MLFGVLDDSFSFRSADLAHAREERPLVRPRLESVVEEKTVALPA